MKYFGKYFKHRLKEAIGYFLIITHILVVIAVMCDVSAVRFPDEDGTMRYSRIDSATYILFYAYSLITFIVPICEFSSLMNKRNSDTVASFPISKWGVTLAHYLVSVVVTVLSMLISYVIIYFKVVAVTMSYGMDLAITLHGIIGFLLAIFFAISNIVIVSFIFSCANRLLDGIIFVGAWTIVPGILDPVYRWIFVDDMKFPKITIDIGDLSPTTYIREIGSYVSRYGYRNTFEDFMSSITRPQYLARVCILTIVAVLSFAGLYIISKRKKVEEIGDISDSWLGYKVLIPLYGVSIALLAVDSIIEILGAFVILPGMVSGYCLYRRGVRLRLPDIIWIAATTGFALIGVLILSA